jgi:HD-GYP domain-containing protein (c-di-GMP phosphodiesterase class II)
VEAKKFFQNSNFFLNLKNVTLKEVSMLSQAPCNIFLLNEFSCELVYKQGSPIAKEQLKVLGNKNKKQLLIHQDQLESFRVAIKEQLLIASRSLSMGNSLVNAKRLVYILSVNLGYIYQDPTNDSLLTAQVQSVKNFTKYLLNHINHHQDLYDEILKQNFHYIYSQPLISSIFLVGFLKNSHLFNDKEIESLFLTSYFKDIGMSLIPKKKWDKEQLSGIERESIRNHPLYSCKILQGRVPLSPAHLKIIECHHIYGLLNPYHPNSFGKDDGDHQLQIIESNLVNIMDILAAMITPRPYREAVGLFEALEFVRVLIGDAFPKEFKLLVNYFHQFFSK